MLAAMKLAAPTLAFVLACDGAASPQEAKPVTTSAQPQLSAATTKIVGLATADVLLRGTDRAVFRVDAKRHEASATGPNRFAGHAVLRRGRAPTDAELHELAALLLADASYLAVDKAVCGDDEAYGLRVTHGGEVVELLFTFPCYRVSFLRRASGDPPLPPGEYFDPVGSQVLALLRAMAL